MKRVVANFVLAVALSGAQSALLLHLGGGRWPLALPLVLVVWLGLEAPLLEGTGGAVVVGLVVDVFGGGPKGLLTFLAVVLYLTSRLARAALAFHGPAGLAAIAGMGTWCYGFTAFLFERVFAAPAATPAVGLLWRVALEALGTGAAAALLHPLLARLERTLEGEPEPGLLRG
jgi:hypothetical protein